ncbi:hypothetical protein I3842_10G061300 [Carya illinoinensis]|uniref:Uncharacterized protein n=1 Tax=Carya illinoinensis TaxID=32201 RepID=A0A922DV07_CARIL|nr:hypothetical protein I3842_10G061300 [Carya illinoinensis]
MISTPPLFAHQHTHTHQVLELLYAMTVERYNWLFVIRKLVYMK